MDDNFDFDWETFLYEETTPDYYISEEEFFDEEYGAGDLIPDLC